MNKKTLAFLLLLLSCSTLFSQELSRREEKKKRDWLITGSDYIFSGHSIMTYSWFRDENNKVYRATVYKITAVLRGPEKLKGEEIVILQRDHQHIYYGSDFDRRHGKYRRPEYYGPIGSGIIFCKKPSMPEKYYTEKEFAWDMMDYTYNFKEEPFICQETDEWGVGISNSKFDRNQALEKGITKNYFGLYGMEFDSYEEIYELLEEYENITIQVKKKATTATLSLQKKRSVAEKNKSEKKAAYEEWLWRNTDSRTGSRTRLKSDESVDVHLRAANQHIEVADDEFYFVFDIYATHTSSTVDGLYISKLLINIEYNENVFGEDVYENDNIECILNEAFVSADNYEVAWNDHWENSDQVSIDFAAKLLGTYPDTYYNRLAIDLGKEYKLYTVKMKFPAEKLGKAVSLREQWKELDLIVSTWATTPDSGFDDFIENNTFEINDSYLLGQITVDAVEQLDAGRTLSAGSGCRMKITGSGFMNYEYLSYDGDENEENDFKSPAVLLYHSNGGDNQKFDFVPLDYTDIESWSETEIVLSIPSVTYGEDDLKPGYPGSGPIKVRNRVGGEGISTSSVDIQYAIINTQNLLQADETTNTWGFADKQMVYWARRNCSEQVKFKLSNNITDLDGLAKQDVIDLIGDAFKAWNDVLGYDFLCWSRDAEGNIETTDIADCLNDGENVIYYNARDEDDNALGAVPAKVIINSNFIEDCNSRYSRKEIDFNLNPTKLANNIEKIYYVAKHELGHGLGLDHVINEDDLMYYARLSSTSLTGPVTTNAGAGATYLFEQSQSKSWECEAANNVETIFSASTCEPSSPGVIEAVVISSAKIIVSWENVPLADSYTLQRDTDPDFSSANLTSTAVNSPATSCTDVNVTAGTTYYYRVKSVNTNGESDYTYQTDATTPTSSSSKPAPSSVRAGNTSSSVIEVDWEDDADDETNYIIERKEVDDQKSTTDFEIIGIVDADISVYYDYTVEEGKTYEYRIMYITGDGYSEYSATVTATAGIDPEYEIALPLSRDALLYNNTNPSYLYTASTNYGSNIYIQTWRWTHSGYPTYKRSLLDFDLSEIPEDAIIESATLDLYGAGHMTNITTGNSGYKSNASWLEIVTEAWDESTVTWETQPTASTSYRVEMENSSSEDQNYTVDITELVQIMNDQPATTHGLMLRLQNEIAYTKMTFASSDNADVSLHPVVKITYKTKPEYTTTIYPNRDAGIETREGTDNEYIADSYMGTDRCFQAACWTTSGNLFTKRALLDFDLSDIPTEADITNATINLFSPDPQEAWEIHANALIMNNSGYKSNACYIQRITSEWDENSVTWNSQPTTTTTNQVTLEESVSESQDYTNIDITNLVTDLHDSCNSFGLMMRLQNEIKYTRMCFASSDFSDYTCRPYLNISYKVYPSLKSAKAYSTDFKSERHINVSTEREFIDSLQRNVITIFPNPATNNCTIYLDKQNEKIEMITVYSSNGIKVNEIVIDDRKEYYMETEMYAKGIYQIEVLSSDKKTYTQRLFVK